MRIRIRLAFLFTALVLLAPSFFVALPDFPISHAVGPSDYQFFVQPNLANIEAVRHYVMRAPCIGCGHGLGFNPTFGMVEGGHWPNSCKGVNFQICPTPNGGAGFVLINNNLMLGSSLDYFNSLQGVTTHVQTNTRGLLTNQSFIDPTTTGPVHGSYNGKDRREIFFGTSSPNKALITCVYSGGTQTWYTSSSGAYTQATNSFANPPITSELPGLPSMADYSSSCSINTGVQSMEEYSAQAILQYELGHFATAFSMVQTSTARWTVNGANTTFATGYFNDHASCPSCFDPNGLGTSPTMRAMAEWLSMVRSTGYWIGWQTMAQQVENSLWTQALSVIGPTGNGAGQGFAAETAGETLLAYDPRVPGWFNQVAPTQSVSLVSSNYSPVNGSSVTLTATTALSVTGSGFSIFIEDADNSTVLHSCNTGTSCAVSVKSNPIATIHFLAFVGNPVQATSPAITVSWAFNAPPPPPPACGQQLCLTSNATNVPVGTHVLLNATLYGFPIGQTTYSILIIDLHNGTTIATCASGLICTVVVVSNSPYTDSYNAELVHN